MSKAEAEAQRKDLKTCTEVSTYDQAKLEDAGNSLGFQLTLDTDETDGLHAGREQCGYACKQGERHMRAGAWAQSQLAQRQCLTWLTLPPPRCHRY
jgi:hypothetical protein